MLSRTAMNLYWLARYMERADNLSRLLNVTQRMAAMSQSLDISPGTEWHSAILTAGCEEPFYTLHERADPQAVIDYLGRDPDNPSSILNCLARARQNARAVRVSLTSDIWEAINSCWLDSRKLKADAFTPDGIGQTVDWVKTQTSLFQGASGNTMLRTDAFHFMRLGTYMERADSTARLLDVKYNILLPSHETVGGGLDYYQWTALLNSVSALRAYRRVYRERVVPWNVAELLILRPEMPRSMRYSYDIIVTSLDELAQAYGNRFGEPHRMAGTLYAKLRYGSIEEIFQSGLHEFLTEYIDRTADLGQEISRFYLF